MLRIYFLGTYTKKNFKTEPIDDAYKLLILYHMLRYFRVLSFIRFDVCHRQ